ncbi:MAG: SRPBCC family protein [Deltaproteobacteria bacterium]|nr:SRPBCC family protein [Deltaproteobacteria bacterium]
MAKYCTEGDFEMSADALWAVVRDFGEVGWLPGKTAYSSEGEGPGMIRTIDAPPIPTVREQLDAIDEENRAIFYRVIEGLPMPIKDYSASMKVIDCGDGRSRLEWSSQWEPDGVTEQEARDIMANMYKSVLGIMKAKLEQR